MQQLYNSRRMTEVLIPSSGKMVLIDKLLPKLKKEGHKVGRRGGGGGGYGSGNCRFGNAIGGAMCMCLLFVCVCCLFDVSCLLCLFVCLRARGVLLDGYMCICVCMCIYMCVCVCV